MRWKGKKINFAAAKLIKSCLRIVFFIINLIDNKIQLGIKILQKLLSSPEAHVFLRDGLR
jgi:hypothetical protein